MDYYQLYHNLKKEEMQKQAKIGALAKLMKVFGKATGKMSDKLYKIKMPSKVLSKSKVGLYNKFKATAAKYAKPTTSKGKRLLRKAQKGMSSISRQGVMPGVREKGFGLRTAGRNLMKKSPWGSANYVKGKKMLQQSNDILRQAVKGSQRRFLNPGTLAGFAAGGYLAHEYMPDFRKPKPTSDYKLQEGKGVRTKGGLTGEEAAKANLMSYVPVGDRDVYTRMYARELQKHPDLITRMEEHNRPIFIDKTFGETKAGKNFPNLQSSMKNQLKELTDTSFNIKT